MGKLSIYSVFSFRFIVAHLDRSLFLSTLQRVQLHYAGKVRYIGTFDTREKAALAYEIAREKLKSDKVPSYKSTQSLKATETAVNSAQKAAFEGVNEKYPVTLLPSSGKWVRWASIRFFSFSCCSLRLLSLDRSIDRSLFLDLSLLYSKIYSISKRGCITLENLDILGYLTLGRRLLLRAKLYEKSSSRTRSRLIKAPKVVS